MSSTLTDVRVLLIADDPLSRAGLAAWLADLPGCTITGQIDSGADLAAEVEVYRPEVVLIDLGWEPATTLARLVELSELDLPLVALLPDETIAAETLAAGVAGLLLRNVQPDRLLAALQAAAHGLAVIEPELLAGLPRGLPLEAAPLLEDLTPREREVLHLLAEGLANKAIARRLGISEHTVKFHVNAILGKLGAQSRTEAVVRATRLGLLLL
ncbi:MAG: response regulator transcription factor [Chloroflexota bacterium]